MIRVRFWGTRGSITSPGERTRYYGGNTPCVQLVGVDKAEPGAAGDFRNPQLILDGGSGLSGLQTVLMRGPCGRGEGELHILLTHHHWDHVIGLPFFGPMFIKGNRITFYGESVDNMRASFRRLFTSVYSPVKGVQNVAAELNYRELDTAGTRVAGFTVQAAYTRHPGATLAFRIQYGTSTVVYTPDHEAGDPTIDAALVALARETDLWILDAYCTTGERSRYDGWGHGSHLEAVALSLEAGVKRVALFHHNPEHDDQALDRMRHEALAAATGNPLEVVMSRDGMLLDV